MPQPGAPEATQWDEMTVDQRRDVLAVAGSARYPTVDPDVVNHSWMYLTHLQQVHLKPYIPQVWRRHYAATASQRALAVPPALSPVEGPAEPDQPAPLTDVNDPPEDPQQAEERKAELASRWNTLPLDARKRALTGFHLLPTLVAEVWGDAIASAPLGLMPQAVRAVLENWLTNLVPVKKEA